jgi:hypothetical protein
MQLSAAHLPSSLTPRMRTLLASIALLSAAGAAHASDLTFKRVWPEWHDADSFQSFYEEHTGHELTGKWIVLRSQPDKRGGLYFLTRVENSGPRVMGATFHVRVITLQSIDTKTYDFKVNVPGGGHLFEIGLTGTDWASAHAQPVAWEVELDDSDGQVLARKVSYLWEKPER